MLRYCQHTQKPTHRIFLTAKVADQELYSVACQLCPDPEQNKLEFTKTIERVKKDSFEFKALSEGKKYDIEEDLHLGLLGIELELEKEREGTTAEFEVQRAHHEKEKFNKAAELRKGCGEQKQRIQTEIADLERKCNALRTVLAGLDTQLERDVAESDAQCDRILGEQKDSFFSERNKVLSDSMSKRKRELKTKSQQLERQRQRERDEKVRALEALVTQLTHIMPGGGNNINHRESPLRQLIDQELSNNGSRADRDRSVPRELLLTPKPVSLARKAAVKSAPIQPFHQRSGRQTVYSSSDSEEDAESSDGIRSRTGSLEPKGVLDNSASSLLSSLSENPPEKMYARIKAKPKGAPAARPRPTDAAPPPPPSSGRNRRSERLASGNNRAREKVTSEVDLDKRFDRFLQQPFIDLIVNHYDVLVSDDQRKFEKLWKSNVFFKVSYKRVISKCWESQAKHDLGVGAYLDTLSQATIFTLLLFSVDKMPSDFDDHNKSCAFCGQTRTDKMRINHTMYRYDTKQLWYMDSKCAERFHVALQFPARMRELCFALKKHNKFPTQRPTQLEEFAIERWDTFRQVFSDMELHGEPDLRTEMSSSASYSE